MTWPHVFLSPWQLCSWLVATVLFSPWRLHSWLVATCLPVSMTTLFMNVVATCLVLSIAKHSLHLVLTVCSVDTKLCITPISHSDSHSFEQWPMATVFMLCIAVFMLSLYWYWCWLWLCLFMVDRTPSRVWFRWWPSRMEGPSHAWLHSNWMYVTTFILKVMLMTSGATFSVCIFFFFFGLLYFFFFFLFFLGARNIDVF